MPTISLIAAMAENRVIGVGNKLPWKLPADMQWFRQNTLGKPIVMGRKTFESFGAKPLPQRTNIVVTADQNYRAEGAVVVHSIDAALKIAGTAPETMIIGGASFYAQLLPRADRIYLTLVHHAFDGDAWFPVIDWNSWHEATCIDRKADAINPYDCTFFIYERKS